MDTYDGEVIVNSPAIVKRPDPNMPRKFFIQQTVTDMALHGEAFWKLVKNGQGIPNNLELLDPTTVVISKVNGRVVYSQNNKRIENVSHLKLGRFSGELHGLGPLQLSTSDLELALMLEKYALTQFDSDAIPRGQLSTTMELSADDLEELV
jgi:phage portal protein BeeE